MVQFPFPLPLLAAALIAAPAASQPPTPQPPAAPALDPQAVEQEVSPDPARTSRFTAPALDAAELGRTAGRSDLSQEARSNQVAGVSGSSVNGTSRTGAVTIDGNAFQNMSGLTVVNANSGNNVAMNGAMTVNVAINPTP